MKKIDRSKYDVPVEQRIGSFTNYIQPKAKLFERSNLKKHMPPALHKADFARYKYRDDIYCNHVINFLSVPNLSSDALRLGLFLFEKAYDDEQFEFMYCLKEEDFRTLKVGEGEVVFVGKPNSSTCFEGRMPIVSLITKLKNNKIRMDSFDLLPMLKTLENYGILTMTEIISKNCVLPDTPPFITNCVYFELNRGFSSARINRKWEKINNF